MWKVSDKVGNCFYTDSKFLAEKIVNGNDNPFVKMGRVNPKIRIPQEDIIKDYSDFCVYFY